MEQEIVSGSGIIWIIYKSALCPKEMTMPAPHYSVFTSWMLFLLPNQQRQSTEGRKKTKIEHKIRLTENTDAECCLSKAKYL